MKLLWQSILLSFLFHNVSLLVLSQSERDG